MKNYTLDSCDDNIEASFLEDKLSRNENVFNFVSLLDSIGGGASIAIDNSWGAGKTFFVKQVKLVLDNRSFGSNGEIKNKIPERLKNVKNEYITLYYDAWKHDGDEDPLLSLIYAVTQEAQVSPVLKNNVDINALCELVAAVFKNIFAIDLKQLLSLGKAIVGKSFTEDLKEKAKLDSAIKEFFNSILFEKNSKLVIFIDELDRCNPEYSIKLLERIKHYLSFERIIFVFSVNIAELECTVRKHYGEKFNGIRYLDKFFDLRMTLPPVDIEKYIQYKYTEIDIESNNEKLTVDVNTHRHRLICEIVKYLSLSMREIDRYLTLVDITVRSFVVQTSDWRKDISKEDVFIITVFLPLIIGLKMTNSSQHEKFINGTGSDILKEFLSYSKVVYKMQGFNNLDKNTAQEDILKIYLAVFSYSTAPFSNDSFIDGFDARSISVLDDVLSLVSNYNNY